MASIAESFGFDLPESLHEQLESVEQQVEYVLELSEIMHKEGEEEEEAAARVAPHAAEVAAERVMQKLLLSSVELEAPPLVLACVHAGGCAIKCLVCVCRSSPFTLLLPVSFHTKLTRPRGAGDELRSGSARGSERSALSVLLASTGGHTAHARRVRRTHTHSLASRFPMQTS